MSKIIVSVLILISILSVTAFADISADMLSLAYYGVPELVFSRFGDNPQSDGNFSVKEYGGEYSSCEISAGKGLNFTDDKNSADRNTEAHQSEKYSSAKEMISVTYDNSFFYAGIKLDYSQEISETTLFFSFGVNSETDPISFAQGCELLFEIDFSLKKANAVSGITFTKNTESGKKISSRIDSTADSSGYMDNNGVLWNGAKLISECIGIGKNGNSHIIEIKLPVEMVLSVSDYSSNQLFSDDSVITGGIYTSLGLKGKENFYIASGFPEKYQIDEDILFNQPIISKYGKFSGGSKSFEYARIPFKIFPTPQMADSFVKSILDSGTDGETSKNDETIPPVSQNPNTENGEIPNQTGTDSPTDSYLDFNYNSETENQKPDVTVTIPISMYEIVDAGSKFGWSEILVILVSVTSFTMTAILAKILNKDKNSQKENNKKIDDSIDTKKSK